MDTRGWGRNAMVKSFTLALHADGGQKAEAYPQREEAREDFWVSGIDTGVFEGKLF